MLLIAALWKMSSEPVHHVPVDCRDGVGAVGKVAALFKQNLEIILFN